MNLGEHWQLIAAGAAVLAGVWGHVRSIFDWLRGLIVVSVWLEEEAADALTSYLLENGRRTTSRPAYMLNSYYVRALGRSQRVLVEYLAKSSAIFWYRHRPLWFTVAEKALVANSIKSTISFIRGTVDIEALLLDTANSAKSTNVLASRRHSVTYHYGKLSEFGSGGDNTEITRKTASYGWSNSSGLRLIGWNPEDIGMGDTGVPGAGLAFDPAVRAVASEISGWFAARKWYLERGIPWRKGCLYEGPPGTGKTSHARVTAQELDLPVHVLDLASMTNENLRSAWSEAAATAPCMIVIEDIDGVFHGRENITKPVGAMATGGLTFDALLNTIDGIERVDGVLLIVTTNHIDKVDDALAKRSGRIDRVVHFGPLAYPERFKVAQHILRDDARAAAFAMASGDIAASKFVDACCQEALSDAPAAEGPYR